MRGMMVGLLMVFLAGISFAAVYPNGNMEKTLQFQLCRMEYGLDLLGLAGSYNPTSAQAAQLQSYIAALEEDKGLISAAKSRKEFTNILRASNSDFQKANSLYLRISQAYVKGTGRNSKGQVLSERKTAMEAYSLCKRCVSKPSDPRCTPPQQNESEVELVKNINYTMMRESGRPIYCHGINGGGKFNFAGTTVSNLYVLGDKLLSEPIIYGGIPPEDTSHTLHTEESMGKKVSFFDEPGFPLSFGFLGDQYFQKETDECDFIVTDMPRMKECAGETFMPAAEEYFYYACESVNCECEYAHFGEELFTLSGTICERTEMYCTTGSIKPR